MANLSLVPNNTGTRETTGYLCSVCTVRERVGTLKIASMEMSPTLLTSEAYDRPQLSFLKSSTGDLAIDADLKYIQTLDWSQTSIGPLHLWPSELLVQVNLAMLSPQPQLFLLGPESIIVYNTAYGRLLRDHHPEYQGRPIHLNKALIAQTQAIDRIKDRADTRTQPANENYVPFFMTSNGRLEEVFLSATMVKLPQQVGSFHATTYDTTSDYVKLRRDKTLEAIITTAAPAKRLSLLWTSIINGIAATDGEISFAALYSAHACLERDATTDFTHLNVDPRKFYLHDVVGDFLTRPPAQLDLDGKSEEAWIAILTQAVQSREPLVLEKTRGSLPDVFSRASRNRCYGDDCQDAVVLPTNLRSDEEVRGLLILGLAPRRPYDDAYRSWIRSLQRAIANVAGSIVNSEARELAAENDAKRADRERTAYARELSTKEQEKLLVTGKIQRMLDVMQSVNVGIFECLLSGDIIHVNEAFSVLSGHPRAVKTTNPINIFSLCDPDQFDGLKRCWSRLSAGEASSFTMSFKDENHGTRWVQAACTPVINNGTLVERVTGCVTDITAQKQVEWEAVKRAEALEQLRLSELRLLQDAIESKRQQENFIDMTSHEIRNPLSAVIHCTDSIFQNLDELKDILDSADVRVEGHKRLDVPIPRLQELRQEIQETIEVIASCTTHQKRITDDILSLSKLDSNLLEICPSTFDVKKFLSQLSQTFAAEAERSQVKITTVYEPRVHDVTWVIADPGRLMQILINLVANAVKFTKDQPGPRSVTVSMATVKDIPAELLENFIMARPVEPPKETPGDSPKSALYLWFEVRDTGCGMDAEAQSRIFSRFVQASPRTYSTYGGSGLGLFVSQKLVLLQDGNIGFTSAADKGSTFAFYVKASKTAPPKDNVGIGNLSVVQIKGAPTQELCSQHGLSILLVEDNIVNRKVLGKQLQREGFTVHAAEHGRAALNILASTRHWISGSVSQREALPKIDLILMDIEMPIMGGLACAAAIRLAERSGRIDCHIPIIAITANARQEQLQQALDAGMDNALSKPFHVSDLLRMIGGLRQKSAPVGDSGRLQEQL